MLIAMKKATLFALKEDRDAILLALQKDGNIMLISEGEKTQALEGADKVSDQIVKTKDALKFVDLHGKKDSMFASRLPVSYDSFLHESKEGSDLADQVEVLSGKIMSLRNEASTMTSQVEALQPWIDLDIPLEQLAPTDTSVYFAGYLPELEKEAFLEDIKELTAEPVVLKEAPEGRAMLIFCVKEDAARLKHFLKAHDFADVVFPKRTGLVSEIVVDLTEAARVKNLRADELEAEAIKIAESKAELQLYYDQLTAKEERLANGGVETEKTFYMQGWVRKDRTVEVERAVRSVTDAYQIEFADPAEGEIPPTEMENNSFVKPYESVIELYSRPQAGSIDPDFLMAPFHFIFFGMMLSDAGYGLVLTIGLLIAMKLAKPQGFAGKLGMVILFGSISTVIWGALFGGWFGLELHPLLFVPMKEPDHVRWLLLHGRRTGTHRQISGHRRRRHHRTDGRARQGRHRGETDGRPPQPLQHQRIHERPAQLLPNLCAGSGHRRYRHGYQHHRADASGSGTGGNHRSRAGTSGRSPLQHHHQCTGRLRTQQPSAVHRILRQVL